jgi:acetyl-CoA carboxylase carboxyl transferase subunit beta
LSWPSKPPPQSDATEKRSVGKGVFRKCEGCGETWESADLARRFEVCERCGHHHRLHVDRWVDLLLDAGSLVQWDEAMVSGDPLDFTDGKKYRDRVVSATKSTGKADAIVAGRARLEGRPVAFGAFVFSFMGGSMGSVVGEKIARLFERAHDERLPVILLHASGGARMQEGILSLMQMAKSVAALERFRAARQPFISLLLNPTTGGVAASIALLGDVNIAEPGALIGFAGARVIETTIRQRLPDGFQRAEFLLDHGMVDLIVPRAEMRSTLSTLLGHLGGGTSPPSSSS